VSWLAFNELAPSTIRGYLSAIRHAHITHGFPDPKFGRMQRLKLVLKGISRSNTPSREKVRLPMTPQILRRLHQVWSADGPSYTSSLLWAVGLGELIPDSASEPASITVATTFHGHQGRPIWGKGHNPSGFRRRLGNLTMPS